MIRPSVPRQRLAVERPQSVLGSALLAVLIAIVLCAAVGSIVIGAVILGRTPDCRETGVATPQPMPRPGPTGGPLR